MKATSKWIILGLALIAVGFLTGKFLRPAQTSYYAVTGIKFEASKQSKHPGARFLPLKINPIDPERGWVIPQDCDNYDYRKAVLRLAAPENEGSEMNVELPAGSYDPCSDPVSKCIAVLCEGNQQGCDRFRGGSLGTVVIEANIIIGDEAQRLGHLSPRDFEEVKNRIEKSMPVSVVRREEIKL